MIQFALDRSPDLIVLSDAVNLVDVLDSGSSGPAATTEWADGTLRTLERLASTHARLVVLSNPPAGPSLATCPTRFLEPASCATTPDERYLIKRTAESRAVTAARRTDIDAHFVDVEVWFCLDGTCPAFLGPHLVRADRTHLTDDLGRALAPSFAGD
ncbi:hypothetical protein GCM10025867_04220 [Frondihabitans sucicola]|uniref:SGNH domain-containing protein n=2 Tax=Frondihabitans sucicola TaxID=1268041 RepID=A0ABM8GIG6_9MICO|nr:hypothetical protein GCM10025867_04220 [Frondihabitans sucicola]